MVFPFFIRIVNKTVFGPDFHFFLKNGMGFHLRLVNHKSFGYCESYCKLRIFFVRVMNKLTGLLVPDNVFTDNLFRADIEYQAAVATADWSVYKGFDHGYRLFQYRVHTPR